MNEFIKKMLQLGADLETTSGALQVSMIINDAEILYRDEIKALTIPVVSQRSGLLFCGGCGNKKQLIVETDINSQRVCKNKLCEQNNCG